MRYVLFPGDTMHLHFKVDLPDVKINTTTNVRILEFSSDGRSITVEVD